MVERHIIDIWMEVKHMFITEEELLERRKQYPTGHLVRLVSMFDPYSHLKPGDFGTITGVDDIGTVHIAWDCGSSLGAVYKEDIIELV